VAAQLGPTSSTKIRVIEPWPHGYDEPCKVRNCKVKTTGIALSVGASAPAASAALGISVHACNHGRASW
jgi:hypothetical protein